MGQIDLVSDAFAGGLSTDWQPGDLGTKFATHRPLNHPPLPPLFICSHLQQLYTTLGSVHRKRIFCKISATNVFCLLHIFLRREDVQRFDLAVTTCVWLIVSNYTAAGEDCVKFWGQTQFLVFSTQCSVLNPQSLVHRPQSSMFGPQSSVISLVIMYCYY